MSVSNPFAEADPWTTSTEMWLGVGNHIVKITQADDETTESSGNPKLVLRFENANGAQRAWENYHERFLDKIVALYDSAGIERPQEGEYDPEDHCRLTEKCRKRLLNRYVGIIVRKEKSNNDPTKEFDRVKGYVTPAMLGDMPANTQGLPSSGSAGQYSDDEIPF